MAKIKTFVLQKVLYPSYTYECWRISKDDLDSATKDGYIHSVKLEFENTENMPVVAIVMDRYAFPDYKDFGLNRYYIDSLVQSGLYPAIVTHDNVLEQINRIKPDGILIPGAFMQTPPECIDAPIVEKERDLRQYNAYITILNYARENKLPTLGTCAGMQMMGTMLGGKLNPKRLNDIDNPIHRDNVNKRDLIHPVDIEPNSLLYKIIGANRTDVVSRHNFSLSENFIENFNVTARATDNTIEAIEPKNPWNEFVLGVQWHPEDQAVRDKNSDAAKIFDAFATAAEFHKAEF